MNENVKLLVMDVDGTLTDGKIYMGNDGEVFKAFNVKDGCGIHELLIPANVLPVIITGRTSSILKRRCEELGVTYLYQGIENKIEILDKILVEINANYSNVAYIGDDINDLSCMQPIKANDGLVACPSDAVDDVKKIASFICQKAGGNGAVREFIEWIIKFN